MMAFQGLLCHCNRFFEVHFCGLAEVVDLRILFTKIRTNTLVSSCGARRSPGHLARCSFNPDIDRLGVRRYRGRRMTAARRQLLL
jgi:hypothetical protein